jgi:hypothetical protein
VQGRDQRQLHQGHWGEFWLLETTLKPTSLCVSVRVTGVRVLAA